MNTLVTNTRSATLTDLREVLLEQHARKIDVVVPARRLRFKDAQLNLTGIDPIFDENGVTQVNGLYRPTDVFDEGLSSKLQIPLSYVRMMRKERPDLYDLNTNGLLRGKHRNVSGGMEELFPADDRSFLIRAFRGDEQKEGIGRAFLSDRYAVMDNLDALTAALDGIRQAGVDVEIDGCDLSDRRMYVRIKAPAIQALAPDLLGGYRSPFSGQSGADNPTVFAGLVISNSETGDGAFSITPRLIVQVCDNGMVMTKDAMRAVHLGGKMDEGVIKWTQDTLNKQLAVVTARARDSVATFLDVDYMKSVIKDMAVKAGKPIPNESLDQVKVVAKKLGFDQETQDSVFAMFIKSGDLTAGGVMHAVTAAAKETKDADKASDMEGSAMKALDLAFAL